MSKWQQGKQPTGFKHGEGSNLPAASIRGSYWDKWNKGSSYRSAIASCRPHQEWLKIGNDEESYEVWLKSAGGYIHKDVDIFLDLALAYNAKTIPPDLTKYLPSNAVKTRRVCYVIDDGKTDPYIGEFILNMLRDGLKLGWGCIGGHGRTGWVAAKVHQMITGCTGDEAVAYIRKNYCDNAIETQIQLDDLGAKTSKPGKFECSVVHVRSYETVGFDPESGTPLR